MKGDLTPLGLACGKPDPISPNFVCFPFAFLRINEEEYGRQG